MMQQRFGDLTVELDRTTGVLKLTGADGQAGWDGLRFYVETGGPRHAGDGTSTALDAGWRWCARFGANLRLELDILPTERGSVTATPRLTNDGREPIALLGYGFEIADGAKGPFLDGHHNAHPVYAHAENLRVEEAPFYGAQFPYIRALGAARVRLGDAPSGAIPALGLGRAGIDTWLVEGQYTRQRHRLSWELQWGMGERRMVSWRSRYTWNGETALTIAPGATVELETTLWQVVHCPPDQLLAAYMAELKARYRFQGRRSRLVTEPVFCTWNYNIFTDINEADCLARMAEVAELQGGGYFQIDHGYQPQLDGTPAPYHAPGNEVHQGTPSTPELDAYYPDPEAAWDPVRFPSGPRGFVTACRRHGLRPSIWWSPRVAREGRIRREHPDWLLTDANGQPFNHGHYLLDYSVPAVQAFLDRCVRTIVADWGFEGMKIDFFSWMFEQPGAIYRHGGTGLEWKHRFVGMIRGYLGPEAYFLHCISCPLGDPFMAIEGGFDAYRAGIDIHSGEWDFHVKSVAWLLPGILANGRDTWFANLDSCLGKPGIPAVERRSRLAFAYISSGMFEFSGPVERFGEEERADYRQLAERCDQGGEVRCPDEQAFYGRPLPRVMVRPHAASSRTRQQWGIDATVALFNWEDEPRLIGATPAELGLAAGATYRDFWTGEPVEASPDGTIQALLPCRGSRLLDVSG